VLINYLQLIMYTTEWFNEQVNLFNNSQSSKSYELYDKILTKCRELKDNLVIDFLNHKVMVCDYERRWNKINELEQRYLNTYLPF